MSVPGEWGVSGEPMLGDVQVGALGQAEERAGPGGRELCNLSGISARALQQDFNRLIFTTIMYFIFSSAHSLFTHLFPHGLCMLPELRSPA